MLHLSTHFKSVLFGTALLGAAVASAQAATLTVKVTNLTRGTYFAPLLVAAHNDSTMLYKEGMAASSALQAMAEGGDISSLKTQVDLGGGVTIANPAAGLLAPGTSTMTSAFMGGSGTSNTKLSIVSMLIPSNDGFVGLNSLMIPATAGSYTYYLNAYDAGTEANNEIRGSGSPGVAGLPVPPPLEAMIGTGGSGINASAEGLVHVHRGHLGDQNQTSGLSDLNSTTHRWLNPIAKIELTVQ